MKGRHTTAIRLAIIGLVVIAIALAASSVIPKLLQTAPSLRLGDGIFRANLALTSADRLKGLGNRTSLPVDEAMIFAYPTTNKWKVPIKDLKFAIDIVWLDKDKKVIYIVKNASIETSTNDIFTPKTDAKYVIELASGTVESKSINIGKLAVFNLDGRVVE